MPRQADATARRRRRAAVVDDQKEARDLIHEVLEGELDMDVDTATATSVDELAQRPPDLLVVDLWLGDASLDGWAIARAARRHPRLRDTGIVLMSADRRGLAERDPEAKTLDIVTLAKPFTLAALDDAVDRAFDRRPPVAVGGT